jgi:hypothetical protein
MLSDSKLSTSVDNPIVLKEGRWHIRTLLMIIAGHPCSADKRLNSWEKAKALYLSMQKYQLDRLQPWFSRFAARLAWDAPWEALCLACNNPCFDEDLARPVILYGIQENLALDLYDPKYFVDNQAHQSEEEHKRYLLLLPTPNQNSASTSV